MQRIVCALSFALVLAVTPVLPAQQQLSLPSAPRSFVFDVSELNGFSIHGAARGVAGLDYSAGVSVSTPGSLPVLHRVILDRTHGTFFGYDLLVMPVDGGNRAHLHFAPLSDRRGFSIDLEVFHPAMIDLPADETVPLATPVDVPLERNAQGQLLLRDQLIFGLPQTRR